MGDLLFEDTLQKQAYRANGSFEASWARVAPYMRHVDVMYANHEGTATYIASFPVSGHADPNPGKCTLQLNDAYLGPDVPMEYGQHGASGPFYGGGPNLQFNYHPTLATSLRKSGIDIVSTANNHCLDRGYLGLNHTLDHLDSESIQHAGTRRSPEPMYEGFYTVVERKGWRTAWVACTDSTNFQRNCRPWDRDLVLDCYSETMVNIVRYLAARPDIHATIAVVHWGSAAPKGPTGDYANEVRGYDIGPGRGVVYQREPDCLERNFTRVLAEAGATVVLGMHPHVPQGFEKYEVQSGRKVLIVYSLGNFISKGGWEETLPPPGFIGRGYNSEQSLLYRRTAPLVNFHLRFDKERNWAEPSCFSYLPLWRRLVTKVDHETQQTVPWGVFVEPAQPHGRSQAEFHFLTGVFGQLRPFALGGGTYDGRSWVAPVPRRGHGAALQCHDWSSLPTTNVDDSVPSSWHYENPVSGKKIKTAHISCLKCERQWSGSRNGCHWCEFQSRAYCAGSPKAKKVVGHNIPWDECLQRVDRDPECSPWGYAGGSEGVCVCMRPGVPCEAKHSEKYSTVFMRWCRGQEGDESTGGISPQLLSNQH